MIPEEPQRAEIPKSLEMDAAQKALRDTFVAEYLIDYNPTAAAMRCGFNKAYAIEWSQRFMEESYVLQKIKKMELTLVDPQKEEEFNRQRIKQQLMREAHYRGPGNSHAARVAALRELKKIYGLDQPKQLDINVEHRGGVMRVPGVAASPEDWEAAATKSQEALQNGQGT